MVAARFGHLEALRRERGGRKHRRGVMKGERAGGGVRVKGDEITKDKDKRKEKKKRGER